MGGTVEGGKAGELVKFIRGFVIQVIGVLHRVSLPLLRWASQGQFQPPTSEPVEQKEYTSADERINPIVVMATMGDMDKRHQENATQYQAELNACMETLRSEKIRGSWLSMFGYLMSQGMPPDECMVRVGANFLYLGMYLERRLTRVV